MNILMYNALNFHWNVSGGLFLTLHKLYQDVYEFFFEEIDHVAELMKGRGINPPVDYKQILELSDLKLLESRDYNARETIEIMQKQFDTMLKMANKHGKMAEEQGDLVLVDFYTEIANFLDKHIYFFRQFLK